MADLHDHNDVSRRTMIKAGAVAVAAAGLPMSAMADEKKDTKSADKKKSAEEPVLPKRKLGKTGVEVTMINLGTGSKANERTLNAVWNAGVRYIDTADCYNNGGSEKQLAEWLQKTGHRKDLFIVTKDHPNTPDEWVQMIDRRLAALKTDYVDLFFIHGLGGGFGQQPRKDILEWPKSKEWAKAVEKMKKAGKIKFAGFSTHAAMDVRTNLLNNAAQGGWVDALMVASNPQLVRENADFNKALDACHKAGVGLVNMKEMRGFKHVDKFLPKFKEMGLTTHQAVLHGVWTDERFSSICSNMVSLKIIRENTDACRKYKPLDKEKLGAVIDTYKQYAGRYCNGCDGSCSQAAGQAVAFGDIVRCLSYYDQDGDRELARQTFASIPPEHRDWSGADLEAASNACVNRLNFTQLMKEAEEKLA